MKIFKLLKPFTGRLWVDATIVCLQFAVIIFAGYQFYKTTESTTLHDFNQHQLVLAAEAAGDIEQFFEAIAGPLRTLGNIPGFSRLDEKIIRRMVALEFHDLESYGVNDIAVFDAAGTVRYTHTAPHLEGKDFSWRTYYKEAVEMSPGDPYIIEFIDFKGVDLGQKGVLIAMPMFSHPIDKKTDSTHIFSGMVVCTLKLNNLTEKFIAPVKSSKNGHSFLIDEEFNFLWINDNYFFEKKFLKEVPGHQSFQKILERMIIDNHGTDIFSYFEFDDKNKRHTNKKKNNLIAFAPIRLGKDLWSVGVWAPKEDAIMAVSSLYIQEILWLALIIMVILLGPSYSLVMSFFYSKTLETEVEEKTGEFKQSHRRLLTVLDSMDALVYVADMKSYELLFVNKLFRDHFGDAVGQPCWKIIQAKQSGPCEFCPNKHLLTDDGKPNGVYVWEFQNSKSKKWYGNRDRAISWIDGRIVRLGIATDITEQKQAEDELKEKSEEIKTFYRILKKIGGQKKLEGVGTFLIKELNLVLKSEFMRFFLFNSTRDTIFALSDNGIEIINNPEHIQNLNDTLNSLEELTTSRDGPLTSPFIPDFSPGQQQSIIPFVNKDQIDGAIVVTCSADCICDRRELEMVAMILHQVSGTIKRAMVHEEEIHDLQNRIDKTSEFRGIIGKDPKMHVIYKLIEDIAPTDATVLIQGESGTGKELVARAIHRQSNRGDNPIVVINCSAYPETLLESELFGHEKGSFTGATRQKAGRFEQADGGTVFLDEIGEISPSSQIKLLRVIQTHKFERLGGEQTISVDVRILAATNKDLLQEVKKGNFREDLFYRLNVIPINLPPLRSRRNDIPLLARHFQEQFSVDLGEELNGFASEAMRRLLDYHWPGNVRELENSIEHAVVLAKGLKIAITHLPSALWSAEPSVDTGSHGTIIENEKKLLLDVLDECNWNKKQSAIRLGISRSTLYGKLKKYKIEKPVIH